MTPRWPPCLLVLLALTGCYPDLSGSLDPGPEPPADDALLLDATDYDLWVSLDLDTTTQGDATGADWDLAARRYEIKLNGGVSGDGGVEVQEVDPDTVVDPAALPEDGWRSDEGDADDDGVPEYALLDWYDYDYDTHELSPAERRWVVRTTEGAFFELGFESYYDAAGTPARIRLDALRLETP